ncbi:unnamed protein product [Boreogadus saida]
MERARAVEQNRVLSTTTLHRTPPGVSGLAVQPMGHMSLGPGMMMMGGPGHVARNLWKPPVIPNDCTVRAVAVDILMTPLEKSHSSPGSSKSSSEGQLRSHGPSRTIAKSSVTSGRTWRTPSSP